MDAVVLLHLTCLTVWPTLLERDEHSWGWRLCQDRQVWWKAFTKPHGCFPSFLLVHSKSQEVGKINIYSELLGIVENVCRDVWYENIFYRGNFKMKGRKRREHFTRVHHCCCLSHKVVKALYPALPLRQWGGAWSVVKNTHTHTHTHTNTHTQYNVVHFREIEMADLENCQNWKKKNAKNKAIRN